VLGTLLALALLPVMVVLAVVLAIIFRGSPLFVHERVGERGRPIRFVKLRSMPRETPKYATQDKVEDIDIPRFARFLRRTHLDELPQLFLVPFGRLSLVGPRPAMPEEYEPVDADYRDVRLTVPQGCTGLWQIGRHTDRLPSHAPEYDFFYVDHTSVRLDLLILWWTALRMVGLGQARSLDDIPSWARRAIPAPVVADVRQPAPAALSMANGGGGFTPEAAVAMSAHATPVAGLGDS
jgi:lipopolysaccharide/colanic/teichoic acid biosynthesis glycosyltransferase